MPKRRERVAPPPAKGAWDFRYGKSVAVSGWEKLSAAAPANARVAWERITADPRDRTERQHPLKGSARRPCRQPRSDGAVAVWVTAAGRLWYCIDDENRTVWLTDGSVGHPKLTE